MPTTALAPHPAAARSAADTKSHEKSVPTDEDLARLERFGEAIDALKARVQAEIGGEDVRYIARVQRVSRVAEVLGRSLIVVGFDPLTYGAGVVALFVHKQLEAAEIGHTVLHGAFDGLEGAEAFQSKGYRWKIPIDEDSWRRGHNARHHGGTNVAGRDPDIHFGNVRLTDETPHHWYHRGQLATSVLVIWPFFTFHMGAHFAGLIDAYVGNGREDELDFLRDRSPASVRDAWRRALRGWGPYYLREWVFWPALAGPLFPKVLLGNVLSDVMRDVYSAVTIFCGHVGEETASYPEGTIPKGRGHWYAMQVEASNDFDVSFPVSVLCGALDRQIEHHLFPRFPTQRLRQVAPEVKRICEEHGVAYRSASWPETLKSALAKIRRLGRPQPSEQAA
ncbi:MAG: fatty acid desaturase [Sandaracinaceae bacterium]|nr:fatty acid desaturase [Sandaracinaceae bacterium]